MNIFDENDLLNSIPIGLRKPLLDEYNSLVQTYMEQRWSPSELSAGKFCEVVYNIILGYGTGSYPATPSKPRNFVDACKRLENNATVPRSFQILIPRLLPPLYEIRNNRGVGHVGGDVDPNQMDAYLTVSMCSWIMGELIRVYHNTTTIIAQRNVDYITNRKIPLVWTLNNIKRILNPNIKIPDQILIFLATSNSKLSFDELINWVEYSNSTYFKKILKKLHKERLIEYSSDNDIYILPPGTKKAEKIIRDEKQE